MRELIEIIIPHEVVSDETVIVLMCAKSEGDYVHPGEVVLEYETSKAVTSLTAPNAGYIAFACTEGESVDVGSPVAVLYEEWDENRALEWKSNARSGFGITETAPVIMQGGGEVQFSARAEALIDLHGIDRSVFQEMGMVSVQDVERILAGMRGPLKTAAKPSTFRDVERIVVVGANNVSAQMIEDMLTGEPTKRVVGYVSDAAYRKNSDLEYFNTELFDFPYKVPRSEYDGVILAMGGSLKSMKLRKQIFELYCDAGVPFTNVVSPSSNIGSGVEIGVGNVVESNVYIAPHTRIGDNNFISYATVIGHHSTIGSHNLFAPGVTMAGLVTLGDECILPTGVNFIDRVSVGNRVIVPVGFNIVTSLEDDTVVKMKTEK